VSFYTIVNKNFKIKIQKKEKKFGQIAARLALNNANNEGADYT
jgi:hypothetical protein